MDISLIDFQWTGFENDRVYCMCMKFFEKLVSLHTKELQKRLSNNIIYRVIEQKCSQYTI